MTYLSKFLILLALVIPIKIANGATFVEHSQSRTIDLHDQKIGLWNIEDKVAPQFSESFTSGSVILDMSGNMLADQDVDTLMGMFESYKLIPHLQTLNLSNNHLTLTGVTALIPLLRLKQLEWLDISINKLVVDDFLALWDAIDMEALKVSINESAGQHEKLRDNWAAKVVLLPKNYHVERFALPKPFVTAHMQYYQPK